MANDNRGTIIRQGNFLRINNAFVEEVNFSSKTAGYLLISYAVSRQNGMTSIEMLRLNVSNNTIILNAAGLPTCFCDIRQGMWIDATFSPAMTRSIPPQSNAFIIKIKRSAPVPIPPIAPTNTTTGRIVRVDANNNLLYTGIPNDINSQTRFVVTNSTVIQNRNGFPMRLRSLRPGQLVRVTHANFQTASIPPQTTAFHIQLL